MLENWWSLKGRIIYGDTKFCAYIESINQTKICEPIYNHEEQNYMQIQNAIAFLNDNAFYFIIMLLGLFWVFFVVSAIADVATTPTTDSTMTPFF